MQLGCNYGAKQEHK